jgi:hypothetical protein
LRRSVGGVGSSEWMKSPLAFTSATAVAVIVSCVCLLPDAVAVMSAYQGSSVLQLD